MMNTTIIENNLSRLPGSIGFVWRDLTSGEQYEYNANKPLIAASVIKLTIMAAAFRMMSEGRLDEAEVFTINQADKMPSCGALTYMHTGIQVQLIDLVTLMIILSDNTATNLLIDRIGIDYINDTIRMLSLSPNTQLNRKLFDRVQAARGVENYITAHDISKLLTMLYNGEVVSPQASARMISILKDQRLNGKIPFYLHSHGIAVAHKTGEDGGITHDAGIVYTEAPFVFCFLSNETDVPNAERVIQDLARSAAGLCC